MSGRAPRDRREVSAAARLAVRFGGSLLVSAGFLFLALRGVSPSGVVAAIGETRPVFLLPMAAAAVLPIYFRALRWRVLVRPLGPVGFRSLFAATAIGFAANMLLPLRAGEVARPWVLSRREPIGFSQAMATVALERLFDMAILLLLFAVASWTLPLPADWRRYGSAFFGAFLGSAAAAWVVWRWPRAAVRAVERCAQPLPSRVAAAAVGLARGFAEGLATLGSPRAIAAAFAVSVAVWLSIGLSFGFGLNALGIRAPWLAAALTTTTFVAIAVSIPGGPGFVGMFQAGCVVALGAFGVERSVAFSYSLVTHGVQFAATVALGLYFSAREGVRLSEVAARRLAAAGD